MIEQALTDSVPQECLQDFWIRILGLETWIWNAYPTAIDTTYSPFLQSSKLHTSQPPAATSTKPTSFLQLHPFPHIRRGIPPILPPLPLPRSLSSPNPTSHTGNYNRETTAKNGCPPQSLPHRSLPLHISQSCLPPLHTSFSLHSHTLNRFPLLPLPLALSTMASQVLLGTAPAPPPVYSQRKTPSTLSSLFWANRR